MSRGEGENKQTNALKEIKIEILRILHHYIDLQTKQSLRAFQNAFVLSDRFRPSDPEQRTLEGMLTFLEHIDWEKIYSTHKIPPHDDSVNYFLALLAPPCRPTHF